MSEAGGPVMEGMGRPEARPVRGVKDRLTRWFKRTFTMEGREEVQREKIVKNFEKVSSQMSPEQKQAAADLLSKNIDRLAHEKAVGSVWRDAIVTAVAVPLVGLGIWKRKEIGGFIVKHTPEGVKGAVGSAAEKARGWGNTLKNLKPVERVKGWMKGIASYFKKPEASSAPPHQPN